MDKSQIKNKMTSLFLTNSPIIIVEHSLLKTMESPLDCYIQKIIGYDSLNLIKNKKVCIGQRRNLPMQTSSKNPGGFLLT